MTAQKKTVKGTSSFLRRFCPIQPSLKRFSLSRFSPASFLPASCSPDPFFPAGCPPASLCSCSIFRQSFLPAKAEASAFPISLKQPARFSGGASAARLLPPAPASRRRFGGTSSPARARFPPALRQPVFSRPLPARAQAFFRPRPLPCIRHSSSRFPVYSS